MNSLMISRHFANEILSYKPETIFVDISSMDRLTIFRVLKIVDEIKITYNINLY